MMDYFMTEMDKFVIRILYEWDRLSTALFVLSITSLIYFITSSRSPDTHPLLLARQSQASLVRQEGESAVFRSHLAPHGTNLISGLNIKGPGDARWVQGKDGDLRDIWRRAVTGTFDGKDKKLTKIGKLYSIQGTENVVEHNLDDITMQINSIGNYLKNKKLDRVAIYLPNSVEYLTALFACAFYGLTAILLQFDHPLTKIVSQMKQANTQTLIVSAGSFPFDENLKEYLTLEEIIFVVDEGSKHIDWEEVPDGFRESINISLWHVILQRQESSDVVDPLSFADFNDLKKIIGFAAGEMIEYTHANIIAGVAGQLTSVPSTQALTASDVFLPIDHLSDIYPLILTLCAFFSNANVVLTTVTSNSSLRVLTMRKIKPTVIVTSSETMNRFHDTEQQRSSTLYSLIHWSEFRNLTQKGIMPRASSLSFFDASRPAIGNILRHVRLIYVSSYLGIDEPISSSKLSHLRLYTRSRIIYALTAPKVAGAITQTGVFDYRVFDNPDISHFGAPVPSLELFFQDKGVYKTTDTLACGEIIVAGPAVVGEKCNLGAVGMINEDLTLSLLDK